MLVRARSILAFACLLVAAVPIGTARAADNTVQRQDMDTIIHDYLMHHPDVLIAALRVAEDKLNQDNDAKATQAVVQNRHAIFDDPATPVGGNPHGTATIVEFFDYRCPYCKQVQPSLEALLKQDPDLRLVYKEFPILGPTSVVAAHAALAAQQQGKYAAFHAAMMAAHGNITDDTVYQVAASVGLDVNRLKHDMAAPEIGQQLKANMTLADALQIHGTPAFIVGDHLVPGAIDLTELKTMVADARKQ
ncbi:MAG TPA: DsbA family protein [Stellaceae bacterium]|nr:DsbA family protein [Stellaceae bacterium]